jgi:hypothetical protein
MMILCTFADLGNDLGKIKEIIVQKNEDKIVRKKHYKRVKKY